VTDRYVELARSYAVAASFTALALLLRWLANPWLEGSFRFTMIYGAVALAVRFSGTGPGILAALAGYVASIYLFTQPTTGAGGDLVRQGVVGFAPYAVSCAIIIGLAAGLRRANLRAMNDARELRSQREQLQLENLHRAEAEQAALEANQRLSEQVAEYGRAEAALRASEERFRVALESSAVPFAILRAVRGPGQRIVDFEWVYLNPAAARIIDRPVEALIGQRIAQLFPWSWEVPGLFNSYCRAVETGEPQAIEVQSSPGGVDLWFHNISTRFGDGVAVWFADVTAHRRAEAAAREARAQLQTVTDLAPAGMARCSRDFRYLWVNRQFADWLDYPPEELTGRSMREVLGETSFTAYLPHYQTVLSGHRVEHEQQVNMTRLGPRWVNAAYVPTYGEGGTVDGWVAVVTDVTQRKRLELALLEADRRKDEFLAVLAHELRNPLAPMRNALEYIRLKSPGTDPLQGAHEIIHRQLAHMSRLVDDLLDLSRVTQGRIQLKRARVALAVVIAQAVESSTPIIPSCAGHR
jgi:PAS domain S-box-containing protein